MILEITRRYELIAGHYLPHVPPNHKCRGQHGHNYALEISVRGPTHPESGFEQTGWVMDFWDLDEAMKPILAMLDHKNLNGIPGLDNPTAEIIAVWFFKLVSAKINSPKLMVSKVRVFETADCIATVTQDPLTNPPW